MIQIILSVLLSVLMGWGWVAPAWANPYALPPLSYSNAELRGRDFSGQMLRGAEFSNANLELTHFDHADAQGTVFSASVMTDATLQGANLTGAMADQVKFKRTDLRDTVLVDAILLRSTFEQVQIEGADFTNAILDGAQVKELCQIASGTNSTTGVDTRESLGCR